MNTFVLRVARPLSNPKLAQIALLLSLFTAVPPASAECVGNAWFSADVVRQVWFLDSPCTTSDGRPGHGSSTCETDSQGVPLCEPTAPIRSDGTAHPKYVILTILYAPPGSKDCAKPGQVTYMDSSQLGTSVSATSSKSDETKLSASVGAKTPIANGSVEVSSSHKNDSGSSSEVQMNSSSSSTITMRGSCQDGVDHLQDQIWIVLDPELDISTFDASGCVECGGDQATWSFGNGGEFLAVRVGELLQSAHSISASDPVDPRVQDALDRHGVTWVEKLVLASADPFYQVGGADRVTPDPARFARIDGGFPYRPDDGGSQSMRSYTMGTEQVNKTGQNSSYTYNTTLSVSGGAQFLSFFEAKLGIDSTWTWSSSNASTNSATTSSQANVTIGAPSSSWTGPISYSVYYDTIFNTYAFVAD